MAIDFPNSPTVGQVFTSGGSSWQWDGVKWVAQASTPPPQGTPNKLVNPFMEIDQANEGAAITVTPGIGGYPVDGWTISNSGGSGITLSVQRVTDAPVGYSNSIRVTVTTASAVIASTQATIQQRFEGDELLDTSFGAANAKTVSLAFWVKTSVAGTYCASLRCTAVNRSYVFAFTIAAANTWQQVTQTIPGDTGAGWVITGNALQMLLDVSMAAGSTFQGTGNSWQAANILGTSAMTNTLTTTTSATFQLGPAGLWVAPAPQPLLRTSIQAELARCQRYYEKSYDPGSAVAGTGLTGVSFFYAAAGVANALSGAGTGVFFKTTKRVDPTLTIYSNVTGASGKLRDNTASADINANVGTAATNGFYWFGTAAAPGTMNITGHWTADARL